MPAISRHSKLLEKLKSAGWATSEGLVSPLLQLALTPVLLTYLGTHQYGVWVLGLMIVGAGSLTSLGAPTATMKRVAERPRTVLTPPDEIRVILSAAFVIAMGGGMLIGGLVLGATLVFNHEAESTLAPDSFWKTALVLSWVALIVQELDNVVSASLKGINRFDLIAKIDVRYRIFWFVTVAGTAYTFGEIATCVAAGLIVSFAKMARKTKVAKLTHGGPIWDLPRVKRESLLSITRVGKWYWLQSLGAFLFNTADRWVIARLFGLEGLATYAICLQLAQFTHGIQATAGQVIVPWASAKASDLRRHAKTLLSVSLYAGLACLLLPALVAIASGEILSLWIGREFASDNRALTLALLFSFSILAANIPLHYVLVGIGRVRLLTLLTVSGGALSLIAGFIAAPLGMEAFALCKALYGTIIMLAAATLVRSGNG